MDGFAGTLGCAPQTVAGNRDLRLLHKTAGGNAPCGAASQEPVPCAGVCVSSPTLVAAEMAEYLSLEWKCL